MASSDTSATLSSSNFLGIINVLMQLRKVLLQHLTCDMCSWLHCVQAPCVAFTAPHMAHMQFATLYTGSLCCFYSTLHGTYAICYTVYMLPVVMLQGRQLVTSSGDVRAHVAAAVLQCCALPACSSDICMLSLCSQQSYTRCISMRPPTTHRA